jgi:hypothetical protein
MKRAKANGCEIERARNHWLIRKDGRVIHTFSGNNTRTLDKTTKYLAAAGAI